MEEIKQLISVDWLSIYVDTTEFIRDPQFGFVDADYGTNVYKNVVTITHRSEEMAVLAYNPRSSVMKQGTGVLKILNNVLYLPGFAMWTNMILHNCHIKPISISRLDLCCDFHRFVDYDDIQQFIYDFLNVKIWKIGQAKYKIIGNQSHDNQPIVDELGNKTYQRHNFEYLRFGSNTSDISVYLYNKSQEFKDVKRKNYIAEAWKAAGITEERDVWRLEFSLKGNGIKFVEKDTGEAREKTLDDVINPEKRIDIYNALFWKYFEFRYNDGQVRKDRMKRCVLLSIGQSNLLPVAISMTDETTKEQKRMISAMEKTYDELRIKAQVRNMEIEKSIQDLAEFSNLKNWHAEKFGYKYVEMEMAEQAQKDDERRRKEKTSPPPHVQSAVK